MRSKIAPVAAFALGVLVLIVAGYLIGGSLHGDQPGGLASTDGPVATTAATETTPGEAPMTPAPSAPAQTTPPTATGPPVSAEPAPAQATEPATVEHGPLVAGANTQITSSRWVPAGTAIEVVAAVTGIVTQDGSCTVVAVNEDLQATQQFPAFFDGKGTSCGVMQLALPDPRPGAWSVTVVFDSPSGAALSEPTVIAVP